MNASKKWYEEMTYTDIKAHFYESARIIKELLDEGHEEDSWGYFKEFKSQFKEFRSALVEEKTFYWVNQKVWKQLDEYDRDLCTIKGDLNNYIQSYYI